MTSSGSWAFIIYKHKLLMLLRDDIPTIPDPGTWSLIGGHAEDGETPLETLRREIKEECNLEINNIKQVHQSSLEGIFQSIFIAYPTKEELSNILLGDEGQELRFFSITDLENIKMAKALQNVFDTNRRRFEEILSLDSLNV
jgi:8-oxo-dGTP diphosphatase